VPDPDTSPGIGAFNKPGWLTYPDAAPRKKTQYACPEDQIPMRSVGIPIRQALAAVRGRIVRVLASSLAGIVLGMAAGQLSFQRWLLPLASPAMIVWSSWLNATDCSGEASGSLTVAMSFRVPTSHS
jgi:hypothetical protein